jgi:hypothetical protein
MKAGEMETPSGAPFQDRLGENVPGKRKNRWICSIEYPK